MAVEEHNACELTADPAIHPLASEEWLSSCILGALSDPRAVCELALVNKNFNLASQSNLVWQKFLPPTPHLKALLEKCDDKDLKESASCSKKDFYFRLCKSISLDSGLKRFWLDQRTGGECYMLSARSFWIAWGSTPRYWQWRPWPGACFPEAAILKAVWWFDISGRFRQLLKPGSYVVSFRMQMHNPSVWRRRPVEVSLQNLTSAQLPIQPSSHFHHPLPIRETPLTSPLLLDGSQPSTSESQRSKSDQHLWVEGDVGRFTVEEEEDGPIEVEFKMREVNDYDCKQGFVLDGVLIRPDYVVDAKERTLPARVDDDDDVKFSRVLKRSVINSAVIVRKLISQKGKKFM